MAAGSSHLITGFDGAETLLRKSDGQPWRMNTGELVSMADFRIVNAPVPRPSTGPISSGTFLHLFETQELARAQRLVEELQEYRTGYRSGTSANRLAHEPRDRYNTELRSEKQRAAAKVAELRAKGIRCSQTTIRRWWKDFVDCGLEGLVDSRHRKRRTPLQELDTRIALVCVALFDEKRRQSAITISNFAIELRAEVQRRQNLGEVDESEDAGGPLTWPMSENVLRRRIQELASISNFFFKYAKRNRTNALRPEDTYYTKQPQRPGEFVLIDATELNVFAIDPITEQAVRLDLLVAMDLYTRSIVGWRLTPTGTNRVDAALLLRDTIMPKLFDPIWPEIGRWRYHGIPDCIVIDMCSTYGLEDGAAGVPILWPECVVVDNAWAYGSFAFRDACHKLGTSIYPCRPKRPTDKAHIERFFRTVEKFLRHLPGYTGANVMERGADPAGEAVFYVEQLEKELAEWIAVHYQNTFHRGCRVCPACTLELSPNQMYDMALAGAGFPYVPPTPDLYMDLLPVAACPVHHYGIELDGYPYDDPILEQCRNRPSGLGGRLEDKWPFSYDPRDRSRVYFRDDAGEWHSIKCKWWREGDGPLQDSLLEQSKRELARRAVGGHRSQARREELQALFVAKVARLRQEAIDRDADRREIREFLAVAGLDRDRGAGRGQTAGRVTRDGAAHGRDATSATTLEEPLLSELSEGVVDAQDYDLAVFDIDAVDDYPED